MTSRAPGARKIITAIARRELGLAAKRKLVRLLFLASIVPPIILTVVILVRIFAEQLTGGPLNFDPLLPFLRFQALPVAIVALGLGTPIVALDRSEDVLFLYATRPVEPWHYTVGKMLSVALPSFGLLLFPGILIAGMRLGITRELSSGDAVLMVLKIALAALAVGIGYSGVAVGASALVKKSRWAEALALAAFFVPAALAGMIAGIFGTDVWPLSPLVAIQELLTALFDDGKFGLISMGTLLLCGALGYLITTARVKSEMIP